VLSTDVGSIHCETIDYDHPVPTIGNGVISYLPSIRTWQAERNLGFSGTRTEIFKTDNIKANYVEDTNAGQNHVTLEIDRVY